MLPRRVCIEQQQQNPFFPKCLQLAAHRLQQRRRFDGGGGGGGTATSGDALALVAVDALQRLADAYSYRLRRNATAIRIGDDDDGTAAAAVLGFTPPHSSEMRTATLGQRRRRRRRRHLEIDEQLLRAWHAYAEAFARALTRVDDHQRDAVGGDDAPAAHIHKRLRRPTTTTAAPPQR